MLTLYHGITSVCSIKVRVGLAEMGLDYESIVLDLQSGDQHHPEYLKLNRDGVVPTLIDGEAILVESSLILDHLDRVHNAGALMPAGPAAEAQARHWLLRCLAIHDAVNTLTFTTVMRAKILAGKTPAQIEAMLAGIPGPAMRAKRRDVLDKGLASGHVDQAFLTLRWTFGGMDRALAAQPWVSGPDFGLSDIALISYIDRFERLGYAGLWDATPSVARWLAAMQARPSYQAEVAEKIPAAVATAQREAGMKFWPEVEARWLQSS